MKLTELRTRIDAIDGEILRLFEARMDVAAEIADYKRENGLPVLDAARENTKLAQIAERARPDLRAHAQVLYRTLFALSRDYQRARLHPQLRAGLLGRKLSHSYSPRIHSFFGSYEYKLIEKEPEELDAFLRSDEFDALNVTIPYKRAVLPYCAELTPVARAIGSVNTLVRRPNGTLLGDNTDAAGFSAMLHRLGVSIAGKKALVLGSGGASQTVQQVLRAADTREIVVISRSGADNYENLSRHADAQILVNATPVGMYPNCDSAPLSLEPFPRLEAVLDLIYNPARTRLMQNAAARGIPCMGGLTMLVEQARAAAERFTDTKIAPERAEDVRMALKRDMQNIILIGMPGCGKSSVGAALARRCGREFVDVDARIAEAVGMDIPRFLERYGEEAFRREETKALSDICRQSALVIATGGGCVTRAENEALLRQNGVVIFLRRTIEALPVEGRPISMAQELRQLYAARLPFYRAFADAQAENDGSIEEATSRVWEVYSEISGN